MPFMSQLAPRAVEATSPELRPSIACPNVFKYCWNFSNFFASAKVGEPISCCWWAAALFQGREPQNMIQQKIQIQQMPFMSQLAPRAVEATSSELRPSIACPNVFKSCWNFSNFFLEFFRYRIHPVPIQKFAFAHCARIDASAKWQRTNLLVPMGCSFSGTRAAEYSTMNSCIKD
jgi:hypothetical protein